MSAGESNQSSKREVRLTFVGCPLLDVTTECEPDLLHKYGLSPDGCVLATDRHDELFARLFGDSRSKVDGGGSALNSAKVAKWVLDGKGRVAFAGCVGDDMYASLLESELRRCGVEPLLVAVVGHPTGVCACLLGPGATRSMCTRQAAAALFSVDHLHHKEIREWLQTSDCVFVVGYLAVRSPEVVRALAGDRRAPDQLFALSLSAEYICRDFVDLLLDVLPTVDILFANEREILTFAVSLGIVKGTSASVSAESAACAVAGLKKYRGPPRVVVVSRGQEPVLVVKGSEKEPRRYPVPRNVPVLDAVGCGDALAGAFLAVYILSGDENEAALAGIRAAVEIAQVPGCSPPPGKEFV